ncbi:DMT family transporter [Volucribacter amazonae]|uniref:EamA domain-containing protein n=1 Tax=Volucribacter amazonae TaxID=256731 RepID=A0A9X4PCL8_9PAST|nr:DMT family transporter [Volucribacter amazonae]MDG6895807.1 hypothetical protein [Volucribacter amazonae]
MKFWRNNAFILISYVLLMGIGFPIMRFFSLHFDTLNNNALRFSAGGMILMCFALFAYPYATKAFIRDRRAMFFVIIIALLMSANMFFFIKGLEYTSALSASIFALLAIPLAIITASCFFHDESALLKQPRFWWGSVLILSGACLFILSSATYHHNGQILGYLYLLLAISIQAIQNLVVKNIAHQHNVIIVSAFVALLTGSFYLIFSALTGNFMLLQHFSVGLIVGLLLAGIYGMLTGMLMAFYIVKTQGIIRFNLIQLLIPFSTAIMAYFSLNEQVSLNQSLGGMVLILGCLLAFNSNNKNHQ